MDTLSLIAELAQSGVAAEAKDAPDQAGFMVVVNHGLLAEASTAACAAPALFGNTLVILLNRQPVGALQLIRTPVCPDFVRLDVRQGAVPALV